MLTRTAQLAGRDSYKRLAAVGPTNSAHLVAIRLAGRCAVADGPRSPGAGRCCHGGGAIRRHCPQRTVCGTKHVEGSAQLIIVPPSAPGLKVLRAKRWRGEHAVTWHSVTGGGGRAIIGLAGASFAAKAEASRSGAWGLHVVVGPVTTEPAKPLWLHWGRRW